MSLDISVPLLLLLMLILFLTAMVSSNLGIGGGILFVPILTVFFPDYAPFMIVPLSLMFAFSTNVPAAFNHWKEGLVDFKTGGALLATALVGGVIGSLFTNFAPEFIFTGMFTVLLTFVGIRMGLKFYKRHTGTSSEDNGEPEKKNVKCLAVVMAIALFTGFLAGSLGIGGGVVMVSVLVIILGFKTRRAIGTSAFIIPAITLFSFCTYLVVDLNRGGGTEINYMLILLLAPMVFIGAFLGSRLGLKFIPVKAIETLFLIVVVAAWAKMTYNFVEVVFNIVG